MMEMTMSHPTDRTSRTMSLIILMMDQSVIVGMITQVMMMLLTHNLGPQQMSMTNPQDPMTQHKRNTQHTTQEWELKMGQKNTEVEIRNETQNNSKNEDEESQDEVGDSKSISQNENNLSETQQRYNLRMNISPNYSHMKTVCYLNAHVKKNLI